MFQALLAAKFGLDLDGAIKTITVRSLSERSDGNIHTDHWSKIITLLIYFNPDWEHENGRFRVLRSAHDIEDYSAEIPPLAGTLLAFRRNDHSYHGYRSFEGERRMLQMSWVRPNRFAWYAQTRPCRHPYCKTHLSDVLILWTWPRCGSTFRVNTPRKT